MARRRRNPEIIGGRVNADGSIAAGDGFTVAKGSPGVYTLRFASGFRLVSVAFGGTTTQYLATSAYSDTSVQVTTWNTAGTGTDNGFNFIAAGVQQ